MVSWQSRVTFRPMVLVAVVMSMFLAGCGSSSPSSEDATVDASTDTPADAPIEDLADDQELVFDEGDPPEELALIAEEPQLDEADDALVRFEADWVCELQRRSFPSQEDQGAAFAEALDGAGVTADVYDGFKVRLSEEQELRDAVLYHYQALCLR